LRSNFLLVAVALSSVALAQGAQAVSPPPDGGYPGGNTAEGQNALFSVNTGTYNTAVGFFSLKSNTEGQFNTATGAGALLVNTGDQNMATGAGALLSNTTGFGNTANGAFALFNNTDHSFNTANGFQALFTNRTGQDNTATGAQALFSNDGDPSNIEGSENSAYGTDALFSNTTGYANSAFGSGALDTNTSGSFNTATGFLALGDAFASPGGTLQTGSSNTAIGALALGNLTTGNGNIALGIAAGSAVTTSSNVICIGDIAGQNIDNSCFINNIFNTTLTLGSAVFINSDGRLGLLTSSQRFKEEIKPMERASEVLYSLTPVAFRYKKGIDPQGVPQFGLIAEQVEKVNPDLIVRDKEGKPYSVRYDQVNAMLLNEFLKEHSKVQQLEATVAQQHNDFETTITELKKEMKRVAARFEEQDARIQKISTRVELSEAETGTVAQK
jgi:Chaperone of endosialidase